MEIKPLWKEHELTKQGVVELVPTEWLYKIYGTDVTPVADLKDGTLVGLDELWKNLQEEGLYDPVLIRVGIKNKKYRLEAGNHRIQVLYKNNIEYTPATVQVRGECGPDAPDPQTDATHSFDFDDNVIPPTGDKSYMKPSAVFKDLQSQIKLF